MFSNIKLYHAIEMPTDSKCSSPWCDRPKFQENGQVYDFCGQTCRNVFYKHRQSGEYCTVILYILQFITIVDILAGPMKHCSLPGCKQSRSFNATFSPFCGSPHQLLAQNLGNSFLYGVYCV